MRSNSLTRSFLHVLYIFGLHTLIRYHGDSLLRGLCRRQTFLSFDFRDFLFTMDKKPPSSSTTWSKQGDKWGATNVVAENDAVRQRTGNTVDIAKNTRRRIDESGTYAEDATTLAPEMSQAIEELISNAAETASHAGSDFAHCYIGDEEEAVEAGADTRDMIADGLAKGTIDRQALHEVMTGSCKVSHDMKLWHPKVRSTETPVVEESNEE